LTQPVTADISVLDPLNHLNPIRTFIMEIVWDRETVWALLQNLFLTQTEMLRKGSDSYI